MDDIRTGLCPLCRHNEIVRSALSAVSDELMPVAAAHQRRRRGERMVERPLGRLVCHFCRRCGFSQLFTSEPDKVPVDAEFGTTLIKGPAPEGPYR
jgi:hypothetical protein